MRKASLTAISFALVTSTTTASPVTDELKKAGLEGTWAYDCAEPASDINRRATWTATVDGKVVVTTDTDKKDDEPTTVLELKLVPGGYVRYTFAVKLQADEIEVEIVLKMETERYRIWSSGFTPTGGGPGDKRTYVSDGEIPYKSEQTKWYWRCAK